MIDVNDFDSYVEAWCDEHPGLTPQLGELFAQWLANTTGQTVIGSIAGQAPAVIATPDEQER